MEQDECTLVCQPILKGSQLTLTESRQKGES